MDNPRPTRALVRLDSLARNYRAVRAALPAGCAVCPAVKADAYGHGALRVARLLRREGAEFLGVSQAAEGAALREDGDEGPILLFGQAVPEEAPLIAEASLTCFAGDADYLRVLEDAARKTGRRIAVHLKVDTGMGRVGCRPEHAAGLAALVAASNGLELTGLATHYPSADSDLPEDREFTARQAEVLGGVAAALADGGIHPGLVHAANSGGIASGPKGGFTLARPGIALYGYGPPPSAGAVLEPVMELVTRIVAVKRVRAGETVSYGRTWTAAEDTVIAVLPVGYADGYPRILSNRAEVLVAGERRPVVGRVCMDQMMVNLGPRPKAALWDEAVLFGPRPEGPDAAELAGLAGTIPYEITCGISARVPRDYLGGA